MLVALVLVAVSAVYASVGQAGGTGFLAVMGVTSVPVGDLRPTALARNIVAASYTTWRLHALGSIDWRRLMSLAVPVLPAVFTGGLVALPAGLYASVTGALLLATAVLMVMRPQAARWSLSPSTGGLSALGGVAGVLSGLSAIGGGVFVAPALIVLGLRRPLACLRRSSWVTRLPGSPARCCRASNLHQRSRYMPPRPYWARPSAPHSPGVFPSELCGSSWPPSWRSPASGSCRGDDTTAGFGERQAMLAVQNEPALRLRQAHPFLDRAGLRQAQALCNLPMSTHFCGRPLV